MKRFTTLSGLVVPLDRADVDTDAILPKQFLRTTASEGYGDYLFNGWRYLDRGDLGQARESRTANPDFVLNQPRYAGAEILLCRHNFGCGSSREQAPWALRDFGMRALIAPSFGEIFYDNCLKNALLPVVLPEDAVGRLFRAVTVTPGYRLTIDLLAESVSAPDGERWGFTIDPFRKRCLLEGLDDIAFALRHAEAIRAFEARRRAEAPWVFVRLGEK